MLPLPRRRLDPEVVRERLRALARGEGDGPPAFGPVLPWPRDEASDGATAAPRHPLRHVLIAVTGTVLAAWIVVRVTTGGPPAAVELVAGTPVPSASGVLVRPSPSGPPSPSESVGSGTSGVVVQVLGQVRRPGLVTVPAGSRVADAVSAAGGLVRGGSSGGLNLARQVVDGEQIVVSPETVVAPAPAAGGAPATPVVDLNTASASDLDALPGVGPVLASRILDWRAAHGRFTSIDDLRQVSGVGARTFDRLKTHVRV